MLEVVGIALNNKGRIYYFSTNHFPLKMDMYVLVETERGKQYGQVKTDIIEMDEEKLRFPLKPVLRIATTDDQNRYQKNIRDAEEAVKKCKALVEKHKLEMKILDSSYTFDRDQLVFHFLSDKRVDFRLLAKDLAGIYRTRIELRQVGVRDKAREVGGYGTCGKQLCCSQFSYDFDSVSINMAKNQNISLNPSKINGVCGRLLCCLKYEDECYSECRKNLPKLGKKTMTDEGEGTVISIDVLKEKYRVNVPNKGIVEVKKH